MFSKLAAVLCSIVMLTTLIACNSDVTPTPSSGPTDAVAPQITVQPISQTVAAGTAASFTVSATGTAPLSFQWLLNGAAISGATAAAYTTPVTAGSDNGEVFAVVVTDSAGSVTSANATLTVNSPPQITTQPSAQTVAVGQTATFTVAAAGTALSYQWSRNGVAISGATAAVYTTPATVSTDSGAVFAVIVTSNGISVSSVNATLTVTAPSSGAPQITTQPANQTVNAGSVATFTVAASGTAPLTLQWNRNSVPISGATGSSYTTPATVSADNGAVFTVIVTNSVGSTTSLPATLTVNSPPQITTQPASQTVSAGQTATFSVAASGGTLTYVWKKNGATISGATAASYTTPATVSGDSGSVFTVVVSNSVGGTTSLAATLTVNSPPQITTQPANQTVLVGHTATFSVVATGTGTLTYQWRKGGVAIAGATAASYTTPATVSGDSGSVFTVVVSNSVGGTTSLAATLTVNSPPQITTQPANQTVAVGATATFSVVATGTGTLTYQWQKGGVAIAGATAASYTTSATASTDNGAVFTVVVSNAAGGTTSSPATLTVISGPQITTQPANQTVAVGATATFSVVATGAGTLTYQWKKGATTISGATAASYTTPATVSTDNGAVFSVVVTNAGGSTPSSGATLTVNSPPQITTQPANRTVSVGQTATFSVVATGTGTLTYQWSKGGSAISGATASSYTTPATVIGDSGSTFSVVVTNSLGHATSNAATLTVSATPVGTNVLTYKYDLLRSGANTTETVLTPANVNSATFGLLRNLVVDSYVDAEPLYVSGLTVAGAAHNVVYVATEHNSVYAFDSDTGAVLWHVSLNGSGETTSDTHGCNQVVPEIGITSTPVIDLNAGPSGTLFVVAMSKDGSGNYHQRLHALNVTSGAELGASPTEISATYGSTGFAPGLYEERAGLLLSNGTIYTTWASHCDNYTYGGWIITLNESTYALSGALNVAPGAAGTGYANAGPAIWMSDGGPAADASGNVYFLTANGRFETTMDGNGFPSGGDYGNSFVKISPSASNPTVLDYFTMSDEVAESGNDDDLGSGGILLLPDMTDSSSVVRHLAIGAGKDGNLYVVNRDNMGKFNASSNNSQIWQPPLSVLNGGIWSTPAYFNGSLYYGPVGGALLAFSVTSAMVSGAPTSHSPTSFGYPGTSPVVSANGTANSIVWAYERGSSAAILHAYDATNLATELYNSTQAAGSRDQFGAPNKFIAVTVADGKVFAASTNSVAVFGLLP